MKLTEAFSAAVAANLAKLREAEPVVREGRDPGGVHRMRTSARRLRSAVKFLGGHLGGERRRALQEGLKGLMAALGPVRDLDVLLLAVDAAPMMAPQDAESLREAARSRRERPAARMLEWLDGAGHRALLAALDEAAAAPGEGPDAAAAGPARILKALQGALDAAPADFERASDVELHDLRKSVKRLRYALEAYGPAYGRPMAEATERCRELQEALGAVQDAAAFGESLKGLRSFAAGQFLATVRVQAGSSRRGLPELWRRALGAKALGRLGEHLLRRAAKAAEPPDAVEELRPAV